jgi:outer membrane protein insertion porin family
LSIRIWLVAVLSLVLAVAGLTQQQSTGVITDIVVTGNKNVSKEAILAHMRTKVGQPYLQSQLDQDKAAIENLGFFKAVDVRGTPLEASNWRVTVNVSEYPIVKELRVVGNTVVPTEKILKVVTVQVGQPFNVTAQKPSGDAIEKLYNDKGYFARVEELAPMEDSPGTVSIAIRELKVNTVGVQGNSRTKNRVMRRLIKTKPGEAYNIRKWDDDLRRIYGTQWFDKIDPVEKQTEDGYGMDLLVNVKEARTGQAVLGVTVDPRSSFAGQARLADTNFNGTGQSVSVGFQQAISGGGPSVDLDYTNPYSDNRDTSLSVSLYSRLLYRFTGSGFGTNSSPTDTRYTERRTGGAIGLGRPIGERVTGNLGFKFEGIKTSNLNTTNTNGFIQQDGTEGVFSLGVNRNRRDVDIDPSRGDWLNMLVEPGFSHINQVGGAIPDTSILGAHTFVRNSLEYRAYLTNQPPRGRQLDAPRRVLAFRARFGQISGKVPFFEQFFAGGSDSIRGYQDDRFWGSKMLLTSLEYRYPLQKAFNLVGFIDYGGAWGGYGTVNEFTQYNKFRLHLGYGIGVGFKTPLGPIRLDFGINEKRGTRTHFLIGTSF